MNSPVIIGGSAGSFFILFRIFHMLGESFGFPIIICVHRLRTATNSVLFDRKDSFPFPIIEPVSGAELSEGKVYLAPPNKHLSFPDRKHMILTDDPPVNYSRPSIDYTMQSAAKVFGENSIGILLTGANSDGAIGLKAIHDAGGITIVQDPGDAEISTMPRSAIQLFRPDYILNAEKITKFIQKLTHS